MDIEFLREFVMLSKCLNYSAAAEQLHISQPVLTRHILRLETEFGIRLLDRNTKSVALTEAGMVFLERIIPLLDDYEKLKMEMRTIKQGFKSSLCIWVPYYGLEEYLMSLPEQYSKRFPDVKLYYKTGVITEVFGYLSAGAADVAIAPNFCYPEGGHLLFSDMFTERMGVLLSAEHPLAEKKSCSLYDLRNEIFFSVENDFSNNSWELTSQLCNRAGFIPSGHEQFPDMINATIAIRRNEGIFIVGEHMKKLRSKQIAYVKLSDPYCYRRIGVWCRKGNNNINVRRFIRLATALNKAPLSKD